MLKPILCEIDETLIGAKQAHFRILAKGTWELVVPALVTMLDQLCDVVESTWAKQATVLEILSFDYLDYFLCQTDERRRWKLQMFIRRFAQFLHGNLRYDLIVAALRTIEGRYIVPGTVHVALLVGIKVAYFTVLNECFLDARTAQHMAAAGPFHLSHGMNATFGTRNLIKETFVLYLTFLCFRVAALLGIHFFRLAFW